MIQGPHQVAQMLMSRNLSPLLATSSGTSFRDSPVTETSSLAHVSFSFATYSFFQAHLVEQPKVLVRGSEISSPSKRASIASRISCRLGSLYGFSESSVRPL